LAGEINADGAAATGLKVGTPIAVGAVDALSEAISVGVAHPGDLMIMYGSTAFFILVQNQATPDPRMWSVAGAYKGQYNLAAGRSTTGSLTRWFRDELAADLPPETAYNTLFERAEAIAPGAGGLLMLPYFSGERTPINDPRARLEPGDETFEGRRRVIELLDVGAYLTVENDQKFIDIWCFLGRKKLSVETPTFQSGARAKICLCYSAKSRLQQHHTCRRATLH
jgi:hypothetical protein